MPVSGAICGFSKVIDKVPTPYPSCVSTNYVTSLDKTADVSDGNTVYNCLSAQHSAALKYAETKTKMKTKLAGFNTKYVGTQ